MPAFCSLSDRGFITTVLVASGRVTPAAGYMFTVPKLKSRHREYSEDEGSFGGFFR
jgi:hypothetical protein